MEAPKHGTTMETPTEPADRLTAFGNQLIEVHIWLREELARLRENVDSHLDPSLDTPFDGLGQRPTELRAHCLAFCSALNRHHLGEDGGAFLVLGERFPPLRPVLEELSRDHHIVTGILRRVEELVDGLGTRTHPEVGRGVRAEGDGRGGHADVVRGVRAELDGLAALLESHFVYEEKRIVAALNAMGVPAWDDSRPDFLMTNPSPSEQDEQR
ncbi:hemerythrin domain-containing protein [Sphaerisporangium corydalis]|uniref:Hemerythrin domain-containing protein n=1 Tax=Sphaerisporangium corydalis TaxID=1441875 RepID=A0ABV9ERF7_9ACTN|nr:hemerythrin domain-containing protein [Sphaerisporangium corydalis]